MRRNDPMVAAALKRINALCAEIRKAGYSVRDRDDLRPGYRNELWACPIVNSIPFGDDYENGISPAASQLGVAIFKWLEGADLAAHAWWGDTSIVRTGEDSNIPGAEGTFIVPSPDDLNEFAQQFDAGNFSEYDARK
jgi:hypothetical protein